MGTQRLKQLVSKNIGESIGSFSLPTMATYSMKDQIKKWGAEVVEDNTQTL